MAKRALYNLNVGDKSFSKGVVYADDVVTEDIDASNFEDVSDEAIEAGVEVKETDDSVAVEEAAPKKPVRKSNKKLPEGGLE